MTSHHRKALDVRTLITTALASAALLALAACGNPSTADTASAADPAAASASTSDADHGPIVVHDAWVKAAESGMSAAFGTLENTSDEAVTVVSASTEASSDVQLHETVTGSGGESTMQEKDGGFTIPAGESLELAPGGNHIMLMGLAQPLEAGAEVPFTLTFSDDSTLDFTAPVKEYSGAQENYGAHEGETPGASADPSEDMSGMDMEK